MDAQQVLGAAALPAPGQLDGAGSLVQAAAAAQALACNVTPAGQQKSRLGVSSSWADGAGSLKRAGPAAHMLLLRAVVAPAGSHTHS